jgi:hypothetical protein
VISPRSIFQTGGEAALGGFKALMQNLKVKTFVGTTENALRIQLWTALLALLLLKWLHFLSTAGWSLSNLASLLRLNLFTYRDLHDWLTKPLATPAPAAAPRAAPSLAVRCWTASAMSTRKCRSWISSPPRCRESGAHEDWGMHETSTRKVRRPVRRTFYFQRLSPSSSPNPRRSWTAVKDAILH